MSYAQNIDDFYDYLHDAMNAIQNNFMICKNNKKNSKNFSI